MAPTSTRGFWHCVFAVFLVTYAAVLAYQLGHGLASLDAHAIVKVTREHVDQHHLEVSRPPGHPTTEVYLFPAVAWVLRHGFNVGFDDRIYLVSQGIAGIAALGVFYALLLRMGTQPWSAVLASICLGLSPQFFFNSVDGEEFVLAIFFLTLSFYFLIGGGHSASSSGRMFAAICLFALATGCRPEVIFAGFLFPLYAVMDPKSDWRKALNILVIEVLAVAAVWLPIMLIGLRLPYTSGMNFSESILGGIYRLAFQCFTLPVFALICWVLVRSFLEWRRATDQRFPENFIFIACCLTPVVFFVALFFHASKPSHALFALPLVLILVIRRSAGLLIAWTVAAMVGFFVTVDIFIERQLGRPHLASGSYFAATRQKPFYKLDYLQKILQQCGASPTAVIADVWRWDIEYHIAREAFAANEQVYRDVPVFVVASTAGRRDTGQRPMPPQNCLLLPRDGALHPDLVEDFAARGYRLKMDATLYRTLFSRYDVITPGARKGRIGNTNVELFPISARWR
jgi:hypothetical protein